MLSVSAVQFFSDAFTWFANLSAKLPKIDFKTYFIVVVALLLGIGLIVGLTYFGSYRFKLLAASKKILRYLSGVDSIDDDNVSDFTAQCFSAKAPSALRDCWVQYLGVRFGYPSEIVSEKSVYDDRVKRVREVRASVYIGIALIMIAIFAFWGSGTLSEADMGVIFCAGLLISGAVYLALVFLNRALSKACLETFSLMQEELDVKVDLQVEKSYATDSSPLAELAAMLDEIIARNTAKDVGFSVDGDEETPLEKLIAGMPPAETNGENEEESKEKKTSGETEHNDTSSKQDIADISGVEKTEGEAESTEEAKSDATPENANGSSPNANDGSPNTNDGSPNANDSLQNASDSEQEETGNKQNETADGEVVDEPKSEQTADQAVEESAPSGTEDVEEVSEPKADKENAAETQQEENLAEKNGEEERSEDGSAQPDSDDEQPESCDEQSENVELTEEQDSSEKDKIEEPDVAAEEPVTETQSSEEATEEATSEDTELPEQAIAEADDTETKEVKGEEATDSAEVEEEPEEETEQTQEAEDTAEDEVVEEEQVSEQDERPVESVQEEDVEEEAEEEERSDGQENEPVREEPEVKYVVEGPVEDDDIVKPAKLVKLPNLVDYMLARNPSRNILVNISKLLITTHEKFKNSPEDVKIVEKCMNKVLSALQNAR